MAGSASVLTAPARRARSPRPRPRRRGTSSRARPGRRAGFRSGRSSGLSHSVRAAPRVTTCLPSNQTSTGPVGRIRRPDRARRELMPDVRRDGARCRPVHALGRHARDERDRLTAHLEAHDLLVAGIRLPVADLVARLGQRRGQEETPGETAPLSLRQRRPRRLVLDLDPVEAVRPQIALGDLDARGVMALGDGRIDDRQPARVQEVAPLERFPVSKSPRQRGACAPPRLRGRRGAPGDRECEQRGPRPRPRLLRFHLAGGEQDRAQPVGRVREQRHQRRRDVARRSCSARPSPSRRR